jgi:hypothetical protein
MPQEEELIDSFIDRAAIKDDKDFFLNSVKEMLESFNTLKSVKLDGMFKTKDVSAGVKEAGAAMDDLAKKINAVKIADTEYSKALMQSIALKSKYNGSTEELIKNAKQLALAEKESAKATLENAKAKDIEAKTAQRASQEKKKSLATALQEKKVAADLTSDYILLSRAYNDAARKAKDYTLQLGAGHPVTVEAVSDAKQMYDTLYKIDQSVGQSQRNVGNYKSAFDGLGTSFAQVSRELPSITISAQQFFLAISNNLPMVFDELKRAKVEIASLRAQGMESQSLMSRVASSLFSWQVALSIGITLLTAYGKEIGNWIGSLFKTTTALDRAKQSQELLNESMNNSTGSYKSASALVSELATNINLAKDGFLDKKDVLEQYNSTIGKTTGEVKSLEEAEKELIKNGPAYIQMTVLKAAAELARGKASEKALEAELARQKKTEEFKGFFESFGPALNTGSNAAEVAKQNEKSQKAALEKRKLSAVKGIEDEKNTFTDLANKFQKDAAEIAKQFKFNFFDDSDDKAGGKEKNKNSKLFTDELQDRADQLKEFAKLEILSLKTRQQSRQEAFEIEKQLVASERNLSIANAKGDADEIFIIEQQSTFQQRKLREGLAKDLYEIGLNYQALRKKQHSTELADAAQTSKELAEQEKASEGRRLKNIAEGALKRKLELEKGRDILLTNLEDQRSKGLINDKDYQEQRLKIEKQYLLLIIKAEIETAEAIIALRKAFGQSVLAEEAALYEIKLKYARLAGELEDAEHNKKLKKFEESLEKAKQVYSELSTFAIGMVSAITDRQKNAIQDQIDLLELQKQKDIEVANSSIANQQDRAAAITVINARAQAQREALEKRQRDLDIARAKFEKAANIGKIIIETSLAVVHQLTSGDPYTATARALGAGAIGAAQLAVAIAQPIPKFKGGKDEHNDYEGLAWVGDGGKSELINRADGTQEITPAVPTLTYVGKKDIIMPDADKALQGMRNNAFMPLKAQPSNSLDGGSIAVVSQIKKMHKEISSLKEVVKNKHEVHVTGSHAGIMLMHKYSQQYIQYIEEQTNF